MLGALLRSTRDSGRQVYCTYRFHLLGVATVGWFAFAFDTASTSHTAGNYYAYYAAIELAYTDIMIYLVRSKVTRGRFCGQF